MSVFFSSTTLGFYPAELLDSNYAGTLPGDVVELTDDEAATFWKVAPPPGKVLGAASGRPAFIDSPAPTAQESARIERLWRDAELKTSDDIVARHRDQVEAGGATTLTADQYKALQTYRLMLRNWPEDAAFPDSTKRPVAPDWLAGQVNK